jgi:hypothetical protein
MHLSSPARRGALTTVTAAQVTANAWIVIQEEGIAPVLVTTATNTAAGAQLAATTGAVVTATTASTALPVGFMGYTMDVATSGQLLRAELQLPIRQG